jgi:RND family efflux transporter MFP subunit
VIDALRPLAGLVCLVVLLGAAPSCQRAPGGAPERSHGHDGHDGPEEPEPVAITRWTDRYELFLELTPPRPGKPITYHGHVTRLDGFTPVTEGAFRARLKTSAGIAVEASAPAVKRPGIFVIEAPAPAAGAYGLELSYEHDGASEVFDGGPVTVADPPAPAPARSSGASTFLKESQWKVPFATAWAEERPIAKEIELGATVEPAAAAQLTIGAPTGGRFFHNAKLALAEGQRIQKGDVVGWISPTVAGDDYTRLQLNVEETRLAKGQTEREIARVKPLVQQNLLPDRRLIELENERDTLSTRLRAAEARLGRITSPGGDGGVPIRSILGGLVAQVLVPNGAAVEPGATLVRIGGTDHLWIRARFADRPASALAGAVPAAVRLPGGERIDLEPLGARLLSALPSVDPASRLATWIVEVGAAPSAAGLRSGATVVLSIRTGAPRTALAVPRQAVVEINTRPFVFVQVDGEHFEKRPVVLGDADGARIEVVNGLAKGERIVTRGGFDIHLASLMGTIESHRH